MAVAVELVFLTVFPSESTIAPALVKYVPLFKSSGGDVTTGAAVVAGGAVVTGGEVIVGARVVAGNPKYSCTYFVYGSLGLSVMYLLTAP